MRVVRNTHSNRKLVLACRRAGVLHVRVWHVPPLLFPRQALEAGCVPVYLGLPM